MQLIHNLDWIVRIFGDESHLLEAGHGSISLGLLLVIHGDSWHIISTVNIDLNIKISNERFCLFKSRHTL